MTRADLEAPGLPVRLSVVADLSGFTRHKLYRDIERGSLHAFPVRCGKSCFWFVDRSEAARYLSTIAERLAS